ncbi:ribosomal L7Ae/L30e/S12e/Gadd45 family protein [Haloimpatiens sp. FM7330]|uniref:ribosomal L7Ae/L30e/S12e/Gadd45 family protein n=1 Tax=Haloimpatiens sp. FM7330 TaxID=3298610 RepID=UPI00363F5014
MNNKFLQFLGLTKKSGNILEGYNKCEDGIKNEKIHLVILSKECSENTKNKFKNYCSKQKVLLIQGPSKYDLGCALGKSELNVLGVKDENMSKKLKLLYYNMENNI